MPNDADFNSSRNRFEEYLKEKKPLGYKAHISVKKKALEEGKDIFRELREQMAEKSGKESAYKSWLDAIGLRLVEPGDEDVEYLRNKMATAGMDLDSMLEILGGDRKKMADVICALNIDKLLTQKSVNTAYMIVDKLVRSRQRKKDEEPPQQKAAGKEGKKAPPTPRRVFIDEIPPELLNKLKPEAVEILTRYAIEDYQKIFADDQKLAMAYLEERIADEKSADKAAMFKIIRDYYDKLLKIEFKGLVETVVDEDTRKTEPFPAMHQRIGARFILEKKRILLADEMGIGKTATAIIAKNLIEDREGLPISTIVVAPNGIVSQWEAEIALWNTAKKRTVVINSHDKEEKISQAIGERPDFIVISYDMIFRSYKGGTVGDALQGVCEYLVLDEIHKVKREQGVQSRQIQEMSKHAAYVAMLSGTPVPNRIRDLGVIASILSDNKISAEEFNARFGKDPRVVRELILPHMLRRRKMHTFKSVGCERHIVKVPMTERQKTKYSRIMLDPSKKSSLKHLIELRKCALDPALVGIDEPSVKYDTLVRLLKEHDDGSPAVVFSSELKEGVLDRLQERLLSEGFRVARIDGDPERCGAKRQKILSDFKNGEYDVVIATLATLGEGVNQLVRAHRGYFLDVPFTEAEVAQGVTRLDRKGQKNPVDIYMLISENSIDEVLLGLIEKKKVLSEFLIDGHDLTDEEKAIFDSETPLVRTGADPLKSLYHFFGWITNRRIDDITMLLDDTVIGSFIAKKYYENFEGSFYGNVQNLIGQTVKAMEASGKRFGQTLDIASGPCCLARTLGRPIVSLDANKQALEFGKAMLGESAGETVHASFHDMPLESGRFDLAVFSLGLLHSAPNEREDVLREANRVMKEEGILIITLPNGPSREEKLAAALGKLGFRILPGVTGTANAIEKKDFECIMITAVKVSDPPPERLSVSLFDYDKDKGRSESSEAEVPDHIKRKVYEKFTIDSVPVDECAGESAKSMDDPERKGITDAKTRIRTMSEKERITFLSKRYPGKSLRAIPKSDLDSMGIEIVELRKGNHTALTVRLKEEASMGADHSGFSSKKVAERQAKAKVKG